jgi:hypothetical protein
MAPKKAKQPVVKPLNVFFVLHYSESSRRLVASRENLVIGKKESLKIEISATFREQGNRSSRCWGLIIMSDKTSALWSSRSMNSFFNMDTRATWEQPVVDSD